MDKLHAMQLLAKKKKILYVQAQICEGMARRVVVLIIFIELTNNHRWFKSSGFIKTIGYR